MQYKKVQELSQNMLACLGFQIKKSMCSNKTAFGGIVIMSLSCINSVYRTRLSTQIKLTMYVYSNCIYMLRIHGRSVPSLYHTHTQRDANIREITEAFIPVQTMNTVGFYCFTKIRAQNVFVHCKLFSISIPGAPVR